MAEEKKLYANLKVRTANAVAEIDGEIPFDRLASYVQDALADLQGDFEYPGFRKGKVPEEIVLKHANQMALLEDAANRALQEIYPQLIEEEHILAVTAPHVTITKLAQGNPLGFKIRVGVRPEVKLPDYKKIGTSVPVPAPAEVADAEVDATIRQIVEMRERFASPRDRGSPQAPTAQPSGVPPSGASVTKSGIILPHGSAEGANGGTAAPSAPPELTDEYVQKLGKFANVAEFKNRIRENIHEEKAAEAKRDRHEAIAAKLIAATSMDVPELLVESEMEAMREERERQLSQAGLAMDEYFKRMNKTKEEFEREERMYVIRQIQMRFILEAIAEREKIVPTEAEISAELAVLARRHPDANPESLRRYIATVLTNEKVLELIEGEKH